MAIQRELLDEMKQDILESLKCIEAKYKVKIDYSGLRYCDKYLKGTLTAYANDDNVSAGDEHKLNFEAYCRRYGFKPEDYRRPMIVDGRRFEFIGFDPKARKYKFIIEDNAGNKLRTNHIEFAA